MKILSVVTCSVLAVGFSSAVFTKTSPTLADWVEKAIVSDQHDAQDAQDRLREAGPQGLQLLEQRFAKEIAAHRSGAATNAPWRSIGAALDRVGGQYDNYASGLYWYTNLEQAKAAARASGRPILSLRLLGRLDEDLSCANSRFFRTTLYPNAIVNQLLKERFILYWESVRPAPRVTIAFEDGRKLERTITGNSIHYVLDADGTLVDALPGLYSAPTFAAELRRAADAVSEARTKGLHDYRAHMKSTRSRLLQSWAADLSKITAQRSNQAVLNQTVLKQTALYRTVSYPAMPKRAGPPFPEETDEALLEQRMDDAKWIAVAQLHAQESVFDQGVRELVARKSFPAPTEARALVGKGGLEFVDARTASGLTMMKSIVENPLLREFANLSYSISIDAVRNNYMLRTKVLALLTETGMQSSSLREINDRVYAEIFLTPRQDPWLGLAPPDVFSAIDGNGEGR